MARASQRKGQLLDRIEKIGRSRPQVAPVNREHATNRQESKVSAVNPARVPGHVLLIVLDAAVSYLEPD
jgi:hypothetical protein